MESLGSIIAYFIIAIAIIVFSVLAVTSGKILRAATYLLFVLFATAGIYFQIGYEFLGAVQIAVYAGGIMVLFVFSILLTHKPGANAPRLENHKLWLGLSAAVLGAGVCLYSLFEYGSMMVSRMPDNFDINIHQIGQALLSTDKFGYLLPFEAISVLLLACIIGGVVIARKR